MAMVAAMADIMMKPPQPHGFTFHFPLGALTHTVAPYFDSLEAFPLFLVASNYVEAYTTAPKVFSSPISKNHNSVSETVQP